MAWSETMFILQHFYNIFDVDKRLDELEGKSPLIAQDVAGLPNGIDINSLSNGTLWFIKNNNNPNSIESIRVLNVILDNNGNEISRGFSAEIPFAIDLNNITLDSDLLAIIARMKLTAKNYYDIIKVMLEILETVPVDRGGTGRTAITKDMMLIGDTGNTFKEIGLDGIPTSRSGNLISSGAVFEALKTVAKTDHASITRDYGVGTSSVYGHLKITDDYETVGIDAQSTAVSVKAINEILGLMQKNLSLFQVLDDKANNVTSDNKDANYTLFSGCFSAYRPVGMKDDTLKLISSYFSVKVNSTGNHTLII